MPGRDSVALARMCSREPWTHKSRKKLETAHMITLRNARQSWIAWLALSLAAMPVGAFADHLDHGSGPLPTNPQDYDVPAAEQYLQASERAYEQFKNRLEIAERAEA